MKLGLYLLGTGKISGIDRRKGRARIEKDLFMPLQWDKGARRFGMKTGERIRRTGGESGQ
ncbi:hypothetical protein GCM10009085_22780 [Pseudomonas avellanae]|nr:hypothetical protein GCM10009085_22780 [Pseudomonas avellanae]